MQRALLLCLLLLSPMLTMAQVDTVFWFAAPEISAGHGDRPIFFRISTEGAPSTVSITQPANVSFGTITVNIPANSTQTVDLTSRIAQIENGIPNNVGNKGLRISATSPVSCYYEVFSPLNSDLFALKGKNSLGTQFYIPGQDFWDNGDFFTPDAFSSFDIVATENNTVVEITPRHNIVGHAAGTTFSVVLQRGQTYSAWATSQQAGFHVTGSYVQSNKPIAITLTDDSMQHAQGCLDVMGDQIVPIGVLGTEYIVIKGFLEQDEQAFVTATAPNTEVFVNGSTSPAFVLDAGQVGRVPMHTETAYITSNKPIYVLHVSGFGCEQGGAVLPTVNCRGSQQLGFTRSNNDFFGMNLLVRTGGEAEFVLNGNANLINAASFNPVPGTGGEWMFAQLSATNSAVPAGAGSLISNNTNSFQMGIINGNATSAARFGYFSNFSSLFIGDDASICAGETYQLDAGAGHVSYNWNTGNSGRFLQVSEGGTYWVTVLTSSGCTLSDTVTITAYDLPVLQAFAADTLRFCQGDDTVFNMPPGFLSYVWSSGETASSKQLAAIDESDGGWLWVEGVDENGCTARDSVFLRVDLFDPAATDGLLNIQFCEGDSFRFESAYPAMYFWEDGTVGNAYTFAEAGEYAVTVVYENGCEEVVQFPVAVQELPDLELGNDTLLCEGETLLLATGLEAVTHAWSDGSNGNTLAVQATGTYSVVVTQAACAVADSVVVSFQPALAVALGGDQVLCAGDTARLDVFTEGATYIWQDGSTAAVFEVFEAGEYSVTVSLGVCSMADTLSVAYQALPVFSLGNDTVLCEGEVLALEALPGATGYLWQDGSTDNTLTAASPGLFWAAVDWGVCSFRDSLVLAYDAIPTIDLGPDTAFCEGSALLLDASAPEATYTWHDGSSEAVYTVTESGTYSVTLERGVCAFEDARVVTINPLPEQPIIDGSFSVCPGAEEVLYETASAEGLGYEWFIEGGLLAAGQGTPQLLADWPAANDAGKVGLVTANSFGCFSDTAYFLVRVNVFLQTEKPQGKDTVCVNDPVQQYSIRNTNGSVYTWSVVGGELLDGQGTASVMVEWADTGNFSLQVSEASTTVDTVCFGESEVLAVHVFKDTARLALQRVSVGFEDESVVELAWAGEPLERLGEEVRIFRAEAGGATVLEGSAVLAAGSAIDVPGNTGGSSYVYYLEGTNACGEVLQTNAHNTLLLQANTSGDAIALGWNGYEAWASGVDRYELWRALDGASLSFFERVPAGAAGMVLQNGADGFEHRLRIRAVKGNEEAWSNSITVVFEHVLLPPNVFTPNGDGYNDTFEVPKLDLYPDNALQVFNRWGDRVYSVEGYAGGWAGEGLPAGVYFYTLRIHNTGNLLRGTLHIMR